MQLTINGNSQTCSVKTVAELLTHLQIAPDRVAVVVNEQVIRRANLDSTDLREGDVVEVITMVGGG